MASSRKPAARPGHHLRVRPGADEREESPRANRCCRRRGTSRVAERMAGRPQPDAVPDKELTPRETEVLDPVVAGARKAEIASDLIIEVCTVNTHVKRIPAKLDARRMQAVIFRLRERADPPVKQRPV